MIEQVLTIGLRKTGMKATVFQSHMDELRRLVETAEGEVVEEFSQTRPNPSPATYMGIGKIREISDRAKALKVKTIVFDNDLTASQQKKIEKIIPAKIVDRTRLILDIFAKRARTKEGQLQVELAQLNYLVPRLTGSWRGYSQQSGGIGTRGPGERKIEVERRYVRERIKHLKAGIDEIRSHRNLSRVNRASVPLPQIALIGYTNAGKSTLLNTLVGKKEAVYADDKLFATLDPTTRRVRLPAGRTVLFTDTVGFIQNLPQSLMAAFQATLEEMTRANLLLHVVDATASNQQEQIKTVLDVVKNLGADKIPMLVVANKVDRLPFGQREFLKKSGVLPVSAKTKEGLDQFLLDVEKKLSQSLLDVTFDLPYSKRNLLGHIYKTAHVISENSTEEGTTLHVRLDENNWEKLQYQLRTGATS